MPEVRGVANRRIVSVGATFVLGAGLALYQLTSLVLGPVSSRQLDLSLTIPAVELQDLSDPNAPTVGLVVGMRAMPAASAPRAALSSQKTVFAPASKAPSQTLPLPVLFPVASQGQSGGVHPPGKKLPVAA